MTKNIFAGICFLITINLTCAQSKLFIPKEIQETYKEGTRSKDGKPGIKYWQNKVNYDINVIIKPESREIEGQETVIFKNSSPDILKEIVIHLYNNVFKKGNKRGITVREEDIHKGINIKELIVNEENYSLTNKKMVRMSGTNLILILKTPLKPDDEVKLEFKWKQKVPLTLRRTGTMDSTSFFVGYWYPQVAVYDDVFGWDKIDYTFDTEFYNNLNNFNVNITAPDNFLVWATGTLKNSSNILPTKMHERYLKAKTSTNLIRIVTKKDLTNLKLKSNTWNYLANEVSDFAFAISDHYLWDGISQKVSGNNILISTAYPLEKEGEYSKITLTQQKAIRHFSEDIPGIPYPYPSFTTFVGLKERGMEFPMMANISSPDEEMIIHEIFHTYFPMYIRINEKKFAWMDEGWADFISLLIIQNYFSKNGKKSSLYSNYKLAMQFFMGSFNDLPTITSSQNLSVNYGYQSYTLPSFTYALLYHHFGKEKFLEIFKEYINRWAKKSPTPYDFFYTFENVSGEDLSWLWKPWYFNIGYPDLAIESLKKGKLKVKKLGERPIPVCIYVEYQTENGSANKTYTKTLSSSVWKNDVKDLTINIPNSKKVETITVNSDFPDFNALDNYYPSLIERFKKLDIRKEILGKYKINEYPITINIKEKEGLYFIEYSQNSSSVLLPKNKYNYTTLDNTEKISFTRTEGKIAGIVIKVAPIDLTLTGTKQ